MKPQLQLLTLAFALGLGLSPARAEQVTVKVDVDRPVLPAKTSTRAVVKVSLTAPETARRRRRAPVNLTVVLDKSGSMSGKKLANARNAAITALRRLGRRDVFSLVVYDSNVKTIIPAQNVTDKDRLVQQINRIGAGGNTALFGGVSQGAAELRKNLKEDFIHRLILLSDGLANVGPSSPADLERLGYSLIKEGISVSTVGVGLDYNEDLMTRLSRASDGNAYFAKTSDDLPAIFKKELGDVLSVVARQVRIIIECPDGVTPVRIVGRDGRIKDGKAEVYLNQLYGGQEKYVLLEVDVPAGNPEEKRQLAQAYVFYNDAIHGRDLRAADAVAVSFSAEQQKVVKSINKKVQADYSLNDTTNYLNASVALMDKGKKEAAVRNLADRAKQLRAQARRYDNAALDAQADELEREQELLQREGMPRATRKRIMTDNQQIINQQKQ